MEPRSFIHVLITLSTFNIYAGSNSTTISTFLKRAELYRRGSQVTLRCEFADEYPEASCVLIYRHYNNLRLTVKEYRHSTEFPVTVFFNDLETYTFAVFGKNDNKIEKEPVILLKNEERVSYPPPQTCKNQQIALLVNVSSVLNSRLRIVIPWL